MTKRLLVAAGCAALLVTVLAVHTPAQDLAPPVTFRLEVNYVEVDAVVTDQQGNPVTDLSADDFELLEDKKPQKITAFSRVSIPVERAERPLFSQTAVEPDVKANTGGEGRVYLIVLDDLHTDPARVPRVKAAARQFLERSFGVNDVAAVTFTGGRTEDTQDFTSNRRLLQAAIDKLTSRKTRGITLSRIEEFNNTSAMRNQGDPLRDPLEFERAYNVRMAMSRVRDLATFMAGVRGRRKAMLFISEGIEYNIYDIINNSQASGLLQDVRDAIAAATRSNVAIYGIDPRGLSPVDGDLIEVAGLPSASDQSLNDVGPQSLMSETRLAQDSLRFLSDDTGGFAVLNQNDFSKAFERIVRENSAYYVLGYYPTNERRDGRFRPIAVRVKRPGLMVRARKGYVAARGRSKDATPPRADDPIKAAVDDAVASPLPMPGIPMSVFAAPYKGTAPNASVALSIQLDVNGFTFAEKDGTFNDRLDVGLVAVDVQGKLHTGGRHIVTLAMKPETLANAKARGFRLLSEMELPAGRYQLRIGAAEGGGRIGSVVTDLEVPDFQKRPFTMSGVALTSATAAGVTTAKPKDPLGPILPGPLSTAREFARTDQVALFAEFYENAAGNAPPHGIDVETTVRAEDGRVVFQAKEERRSTELQGGRGGYGVSVVIPLREFEPGLYVIHVEGRTRGASADGGVGRDVQIRVR